MSETSDDEEGNLPEIPLAELLDDLEALGIADDEAGAAQQDMDMDDG